MTEVINYLLTRTTPDGVAVAIGDVIAMDDETAVAEASNDVRSRCARHELSQDDVIACAGGGQRHPPPNPG